MRSGSEGWGGAAGRGGRRCVAIAALIGGAATAAAAQPTVYGELLPLVAKEDLDPYAKPALAAGELGSVVGTWGEHGVGARLHAGAISGSNGALGSGEVSSTVARLRTPAALATVPGGRALVAYSVRGTRPDVGLWVRPIDPTGLPVDVEVRIDDPVSLETSIQPALASLPGPRFVVSWIEGASNGFGARVEARFLDVDGEPTAPAFRVDQGQAGKVTAPTVASDGDGDFVVAWEAHTGSAASEIDIHARRYDSSGTALTGELLVNEHTAAFQTDPFALAGERGEFLIAWTSEAAPGDASFTGVSVRSFDAAGRGLTPETRLNDSVDGVQAKPVLARGGGGALMAFWEQYLPAAPVHALRARVLEADGTPTGPELPIDAGGSAVRHDLRVAGGGASTGFFTSWIGSDLIDPYSGEELLGQRIASSPPIFRDGFEDESTDGWDEVTP